MKGHESHNKLQELKAQEQRVNFSNILFQEIIHAIDANDTNYLEEIFASYNTKVNRHIDGLSALHHAIKQGKPEMILVLLRAGINPDEQSPITEKTAHDLANELKSTSSIHQEISNLLVNYKKTYIDFLLALEMESAYQEVLLLEPHNIAAHIRLGLLNKKQAEDAMRTHENPKPYWVKALRHFKAAFRYAAPSLKLFEYCIECYTNLEKPEYVNKCQIKLTILRFYFEFQIPDNEQEKQKLLEVAATQLVNQIQVDLNNALSLTPLGKYVYATLEARGLPQSALKKLFVTIYENKDEFNQVVQHIDARVGNPEFQFPDDEEENQKLLDEAAAQLVNWVDPNNARKVTVWKQVCATVEARGLPHSVLKKLLVWATIYENKDEFNHLAQHIKDKTIITGVLLSAAQRGVWSCIEDALETAKYPSFFSQPAVLAQFLFWSLIHNKPSLQQKIIERVEQAKLSPAVIEYLATTAILTPQPLELGYLYMVRADSGWQVCRITNTKEVNNKITHVNVHFCGTQNHEWLDVESNRLAVPHKDWTDLLMPGFLLTVHVHNSWQHGKVLERKDDSVTVCYSLSETLNEKHKTTISIKDSHLLRLREASPFIQYEGEFYTPKILLEDVSPCKARRFSEFVSKRVTPATLWFVNLHPDCIYATKWLHITEENAKGTLKFLQDFKHKIPVKLLQAWLTDVLEDNSKSFIRDRSVLVTALLRKGAVPEPTHYVSAIPLGSEIFQALHQFKPELKDNEDKEETKAIESILLAEKSTIEQGIINCMLKYRQLSIKALEHLFSFIIESSTKHSSLSCCGLEAWVQQCAALKKLIETLCDVDLSFLERWVVNGEGFYHWNSAGRRVLFQMPASLQVNDYSHYALHNLVGVLFKSLEQYEKEKASQLFSIFKLIYEGIGGDKNSLGYSKLSEIPAAFSNVVNKDPAKRNLSEHSMVKTCELFCKHFKGMLKLKEDDLFAIMRDINKNCIRESSQRPRISPFWDKLQTGDLKDPIEFLSSATGNTFQ